MIQIPETTTQVDNQLVVTPYPALLYPVRETLAPRISQVPAVAGGGQDRQVRGFDVHGGGVPVYPSISRPLYIRRLEFSKMPLMNIPHTVFEPMSICPGPYPPFSPEISAVLNVEKKGCFEVNFQRDLGCTWAHVVRLASLQLAPFDVNLDGALVNALLELSSRAMEYMEVRYIY